jgi:aspartate/methionine/tyrosine aminotransferase
LTADYTRKRDLFLGYLDAAGLTYTKPQGAYYVMVDCTAFRVTDDQEFCRWMAREPSGWPRCPVPVSFTNRSTI